MKPLLQALFVAILFALNDNIEAVVVIQYHHIDDSTPADTSVAPDRFAQHMDYLSSNGFHVWPLPRMIRSLQDGVQLSGKDIAITFDDSYISIHRNALPILKKYHFPFTVFTNTDNVGGNHFMDWDELRELTQHGGTIANHTASHSHLIRSLDEESDRQWEERIKNQIVKAENIIRKQIGHSPGLLAYPYGEYDKRVKAIASSLNIVAFTQHSAAFDQSVDWQAVPRFAFGGQYADIDKFIDKVNSLPLALEEVIVKDERGQTLDDPLLPANSARPELILKLKSSELAHRIQCFASHIGRIDVDVNGNTVTTNLKQDLPTGRSRINCTAPSQQRGRFYWYSQLFIRKMEDGSWRNEP